MSTPNKAMREVWEESFAEQIARSAYNTAPVEALIRNVSDDLRDRHPDGDYTGLRFLEMDAVRARTCSGSPRRESTSVGSTSPPPRSNSLGACCRTPATPS